MVEPDTNVEPASSSITCAKMWRDERLATKRRHTQVTHHNLRRPRWRHRRGESSRVRWRRRAAFLSLPLILTVDITYLPFRPCGGWSHLRSEYPWPYKVR